MKKSNLQELFLNAARKDKIPMVVYLNNGIKLQGYITGYDNFVIILKRDNNIQLVYKHSISTILPTTYMNFHYIPENTNVEEKLEHSAADKN